MDCTKIGGLSKDSWECSGIVQPFCNPQDCERLRQIWELTQNPAALCQDCKKMVQSTIPAEHSAKWLRISVEFRNGPAIHTIFMQCFQSSCNPFHTCNSDTMQLDFESIPKSDAIFYNTEDCKRVARFLSIPMNPWTILQSLCYPFRFVSSISNRSILGITAKTACHQLHNSKLWDANPCHN